MKKILNKIFGKLFFGFLLVFLQFIWIMFLVYKATLWNSILDLVLRIIAIVLSVYIANKDLKPYFKLSWIILILVLPFFGCTCYYMFGRSELTKRTRQKMTQNFQYMDTMLTDNKKIIDGLNDVNPYAAKQIRYIANCAPYPPYYEDSSQYFSCGEKFYPVFLEDLKNAKHFIFLEYFIISKGEMFEKILDILEEKVKEGLDVRIIYDDFGSIGYVPHKFYKQIRKRGIKCVCFNPFRPVLSVIMNNRDHRKICVIDGEIAYTGGINLSNEYINIEEKFGYWKDAAIRITGEAVWSFTNMFLGMWRYITKTDEDYLKFKVEQEVVTDYKGIIQPYGDSPMDKEDVGEIVYLNMISNAKKYVYIYTPYLVIGSEMQEVLMNAAKSGIDVRIVVPGIPDKKMVYLLTQSNFEPLIKAGVKIYKYTTGFVHSKCFVVDDEYATVGSINLDYRSLYLHFECGVFMYQTSSVLDVKEDFFESFKHSKRITLEEARKKLAIYRVFLMILRLFAPLL